jgi:hypothetical protein
MDVGRITSIRGTDIDELYTRRRRHRCFLPWHTHHCERCHKCADSDVGIGDIEGPKTVCADAYVDKIDDTTFRKETTK